MIFTIIEILKQFSLFVGYVKSEKFKEQLTSSEQEKYLKMLNSENKEYAREKLIVHNLRLVAHIIKKYDNCGLLYDDLISVGTIGLIKAIDSFSMEKANKASSYFAKCIENEILMYIRSNKKTLTTLSLFDSIGEDEEGQEIKLEDIVSSESIDYNDKLDKQNLINKLFKHLKKLDEFEYKILKLRYGLENSNQYTQKEIGKMFNISRSYVSRIEKKALNKLLFEFRKEEL